MNIVSVRNARFERQYAVTSDRALSREECLAFQARDGFPQAGYGFWAYQAELVTEGVWVTSWACARSAD